MNSVNIQHGSELIGNIFSFARNHIFSSKHLSISKLAALALTLGAGYVLVQASRKFVATATPSKNPEEEKITTHFYRITGKNITEDRPVYLLGTDNERPCNEYPKHLVQTIKKCQVLATYLPPEAHLTTLRPFVANTLTETMEKLKQNDTAWFRDQFSLIGCQGDYLETQMQLVRDAQATSHLTLESWHDLCQLQSLATIQKHLANYPIDALKTHPLVVMNLLGNELDAQNENLNGIESALIPFFEAEPNHSCIRLEGRDIMAANIVHDFLYHYYAKPSDFAEKTQMFCRRLETGYFLNDEESLRDYEQQPRLYRDRFINKKGSNDKLVSLQSTIVAKNFAWRAPILKALQQDKSTAIVIPRENLDLEWNTGALNFLRSQGYTVELA